MKPQTPAFLLYIGKTCQRLQIGLLIWSTEQARVIDKVETDLIGTVLWFTFGCHGYVSLRTLNYIAVTFTVLIPERLPPEDGPETTRL